MIRLKIKFPLFQVLLGDVTAAVKATFLLPSVRKKDKTNCQAKKNNIVANLGQNERFSSIFGGLGGLLCMQTQDRNLRRNKRGEQVVLCLNKTFAYERTF